MKFSSTALGLSFLLYGATAFAPNVIPTTRFGISPVTTLNKYFAPIGSRSADDSSIIELNLFFRNTLKRMRSTKKPSTFRTMPPPETDPSPTATITSVDTGIEELLAQNDEWRKQKMYEDPEFFDKLGAVHAPSYMWIGCSDARVPPNMITNEDPGSIFVVRNVANMVNNNDNNLMSALTYAVDVLKIPNIIVCGHYDCGGVRASTTNADHSAPLENWVQNIRDVYRLHKDELDLIKDPEQRHRRLVELNVKEQCINLFKTPVIQKSRIESYESGSNRPLPRIHACVFDPKTGSLKKLDFDFQKEIRDLHSIYALYSVNPDIDVVKRLEKTIKARGPAPSGILINKVDQSIKRHFPGALTTADFAKTLRATLESKGYTMEKTLLATSLCCEEINREFEGDLTGIFGQHFNMGGLSGTPFGGITSFGAMTAHIPDGGDCCVVYGPHVGIDSDGVVGKVNRRGRKESGASCESAQVALAYVKDVRKGKIPKRDAPDMSATDFADSQQIFVNNSLLPSTSRILYSKEPMVELPRALFDVQDELMTKIVKAGSAGVGKHSPKGTVVKVGGIQINTPPKHADYFLPMSFEIFDQNGEVIEVFDMKYKYIER